MGSGTEHCFQLLPLCSTPTTMEVIDLTENVSFHGNSSFYDEFLEDDEVSDLDARQVPLTAFPSSSTACGNYEDLSSLGDRELSELYDLPSQLKKGQYFPGLPRAMILKDFDAVYLKERLETPLLSE